MPREEGATEAKPCNIEKTLDIIGSKWTFLIIRDLLTGPKRFGELLDSLSGISPKTLSLRLRDLEQHQIITRTVYPVIPPHVEYNLTDSGKALQPIFEAMSCWADSYAPHEEDQNETSSPETGELEA